MPPKKRSKSSLSRLYKIIDWLRQKRRFTTTDVAEAFEISRRTVLYDIEYLRDIGFPIAFDAKRNTYVLTDTLHDLPWNAITGNEMATLLVAGLALEALGDTPHASLLASVVDRLGELLPDAVHLSSESMSRMLRFDIQSANTVPLKTMEGMYQAIDEQRVVHIHYHSNSKNEQSDRDVEPYSLLCTQGRWYLIAFCRKRKDMRDFRLDRIRSYQLRDEVFAIPPKFDLDAYLGPAFGMHRGDRTYPVRIRFSAYQARWIQEEVWHESQILKRRDDGVLEVLMQVTGLNDVARWVLSYGGEAEVLSPPVLRHRVAVEARRMAAFYANDQPYTPKSSCD